MTGVEPRKAALLILDIGTPADPTDVVPFLRRLYADPLVLPLPFGLEYQKTFARFMAWRRAPPTQAALAALGGTTPERTHLLRLGEALCARLNESGELRFSPFVALRHAEPSIATAVNAARAEGCQRIVGLFARPFQSSAGSRTAMVELRERTDGDAELDVSMVDRSSEDPEVRRAFAALLEDTLLAIPASARDGAHVLLTLDSQPIEGSLDPRLPLARAFLQSMQEALGTATPCCLGYLSGTDPRASLLPEAEAEIERLARAGCRALVAAPIGHLCESMHSLHEVDRRLRALARQKGIAEFIRTPAPGSRPDLISALAQLLLRHVSDMAVLREPS